MIEPDVARGIKPFRYHAEQQRFITSTARFKIVHSGRRSGKTEIAKRIGADRALSEDMLADCRVVCSAPTHDQARRIFWEDLKRLCPSDCVDTIWESRLTIRLVNGAQIEVIGLDKPERLEGSPIDLIIVTEFANTRPGIWEKHIRPALMTDGRPGKAILEGTPEGQNHMHTLLKEALADIAKHGDDAEWGVYGWSSEDILDAKEIESAKRMDPRTYAQEIGGQFVSRTGLAYHEFVRSLHAARAMPYEVGRPLILAFDFNKSPGVCGVGQEREWPKDVERPRWRHPQDVGPRPKWLAEEFDAWIGQVWIPADSTTRKVCRRLISDWGPEGTVARHVGEVWIDGDATGGTGGAVQEEGSHWEEVHKMLDRVAGWKVYHMYDRSNPRELVRVIAMNSRLMGADGLVRTQIDPDNANQIADDLELTMTIEGGSGELLKDPKKYPERTHISDGTGYHVARAHPTVEVVSSLSH